VLRRRHKPELEGSQAVAQPLRVPEFLNVPWSIKDLFVFGLAWFGLQIVILIVLGLISPWVPSLGAFFRAAEEGNVGASFVLDLLDAGVGFGVVALYLRKYMVGWNMVGWRRVELRWKSVLKALLYIVVALMAFMVLANVLLMVIHALWPSFDPNQAQDNEFTGEAGKAHPSLALVALVLLPPVLEETIFRGFLFPAIAKRTGLIWGAVLSSIVFGLAHWQANVSIYTFILGLILCLMYVKTKSIWPGIFLHMANNYLALLAMNSK
jgi:membrane protease YdiL (CAAX protease family)